MTWPGWWLHVRAAAAAGVPQPGALDALGLLIAVNRRGRQRDADMLIGHQTVLRRVPGPPSAVSAVASITSGASSSAARKLLLVAPPSTITVVSATARRSRARASDRSLPTAMILAIIESKSGGMTSPSTTPVSMRIPGPVGQRSNWTRPGAGAKSRSGSSAFSRASTACPRSVGGGPSSRPPAATCSCAFTRSKPGGSLGDGVLDLQPRIDLKEREGSPPPGGTGTRRCTRRSSRPPRPAARRTPSAPAPAPATAAARPTPR